MLWSSSQMWIWLLPYSVGFILRKCASEVGFIPKYSWLHHPRFSSLQHSQTNRRGLYTLLLTSKYRCMQNISPVDALLTTQNVLSLSGRFGGGHTGWSQLQLASSVSPLWHCSAFLSGPRVFHDTPKDHIIVISRLVHQGTIRHSWQLIATLLENYSVNG